MNRKTKTFFEHVDPKKVSGDLLILEDQIESLLENW